MANFNVKSLLEAKNPQTVMLEQTRGLKTKWSKTGLLEGLKDRDQHSMAVLLENQAQQLLQEASQTNANGQGSEEWSGVALPLVRRIFGEIAAKEFVSVQPMNLPSGLIFFMDFKYGSAKGGKVAGDSLYGTGSKFGRTETAAGGLYGEGAYGYSLAPTSSNTTSITATLATASWADFGFDANYSASAALDGAGTRTWKKVTIPTSQLSGSDIEAVKLVSFGTTNFTSSLAAFAKHDYAGNNYTFIAQVATALTASATATFAGTNVGNKVTFQTQPISYQRGDFEDQTPIAGGANQLSGTNLNIPEIDLELKSESIVAKTRKLKAVWTPELAQDLNAYHSIDAEAELTSMLSEYISLEIDLEILDMLKANALTTEYWSLKVGQEWNGSGFSIDSDVAAASAYTRNTWFQTLGTKLNKVSNKIHQLTMRGGANFLVASPDVCTILESIPAFSVSADKDAKQFAAGVTQVGSIANRYTVYKNPYMTENVILMGYKGNNFLETGAVYAPYVPLILTPLVYDPDNFTPRRGVMTRYAKKLVRPEFFGKVVIGDLNLL